MASTSSRFRLFLQGFSRRISRQLLAPRIRRYLILALVTVTFCILLLFDDRGKQFLKHGFKKEKGSTYLPKATWEPPPIQDPFPLLATSYPPQIPPWNVPRPGLHKTYGLPYAPPLLIGFTRTWPLLLQAVVSYITAGWPPEQIFVIENTGVQRANLEGKLSLQNTFYLNHTQLKKQLGVNVIRTPVLMSFAQLQNFYIHLSHENNWPYYFWSHMDVLALSFEDGKEGVTPQAGKEGYKTLYELCLAELSHTLAKDKRWAQRFFAYDHLTLVNREAYEAVGGWDVFIPYYTTDCDMHSRITMANYSRSDATAGIIADVSTVLDNLLMLYRNTSYTPAFTDPNPLPPGIKKAHSRTPDPEDPMEYWRLLHYQAAQMTQYKLGNSRGRNTWHFSQHKGADEPFYYPARGLEEGISALNAAGKDIFTRKWGHRKCDFGDEAGLKSEDAWTDWE